MHPLTRSRYAGFTLVELMVAIAIMGTLLAVGIPNMTTWVLSNKARGASEFYAEGLATARREAVTRNAASRFVLSPNANGQLDWQVDVCFPVPGTPCSADSGSWSTVAAAADNDPNAAAPFKSIFRAASALPHADALVPTLQPEGSTGVYFTALGWVDTSDPQRLTRLTLTPAASLRNGVPTVALAIPLAGVAAKCNPDVAAPDSRACP
ncbi:GspH/FimT family pseudopilin [Pseudoduganella armeniaca]|uniref:Type II secretion system protein H n=1 Tax=Pseudoduganella armeniaca TaxID=2072590 RepID=A0A2R4CCD4_9BURK|nr:GspH/FimT family pseudopilin [Pseudoduganella armeniaca]AVR97269.1 prepilin-type cleavage/methylation domain-containing protein [Pseudoduganella armeniaca]